MDTHKVDGMCSHTSMDAYIWRDGVVQVMYEVLWKKLGKVIGRLGKLVEL